MTPRQRSASRRSLLRAAWWALTHPFATREDYQAFSRKNLRRFRREAGL